MTHDSLFLGISLPWAAVLLAFIATFIWRIFGVVLASAIRTDSVVMVWINALAYAMVAGVLMLILVYPSGSLANTPLDYRLGALGLSVLCMLTVKSLWLSILVGIGGFAIALHLF